MSLSIIRRKLHRSAGFLRGLLRLALLRQHADQSESRLYESGLRLNRGPEMCDRGLDIPLLGQHPTQCRLCFRIIRSQAHRLLEF